VIDPNDTPQRIFKCAGCGRPRQRKVVNGTRCPACDSTHWFVYVRGEPFGLDSEEIPTRRPRRR
jgi:DNA-directed RNA polymerase subunit RPC12/RpoP